MPSKKSPVLSFSIFMFIITSCAALASASVVPDGTGICLSKPNPGINIVMLLIIVTVIAVVVAVLLIALVLMRRRPPMMYPPPGSHYPQQPPAYPPGPPYGR